MGWEFYADWGHLWTGDGISRRNNGEIEGKKWREKNTF